MCAPSNVLIWRKLLTQFAHHLTYWQFSQASLAAHVKTLDLFALVTVGNQFHSSARRLVAAVLFIRCDSGLTFSLVHLARRNRLPLSCCSSSGILIPPIPPFCPSPASEKTLPCCENLKWIKCVNFPGSCFTPPLLSS